MHNLTCRYAEFIMSFDNDQNKADFADCLIVQLNKFHGFQQTFTFDKAATKHNLFTLCNT